MTLRVLLVAAALFASACPSSPRATDSGAPGADSGQADPMVQAREAALREALAWREADQQEADRSRAAQAAAAEAEEARHQRGEWTATDFCGPGEPLECWLAKDPAALVVEGQAGLESLKELHGTEVNLALTFNAFEAACELRAPAGCRGVLSTLAFECKPQVAGFSKLLARHAAPRSRAFLQASARQRCPAAEACATALRNPCAPCFLACALADGAR